MIPDNGCVMNDDGPLGSSGGAEVGGGGEGGGGDVGGDATTTASTTTMTVVKMLKKGPWTVAEDSILIEYVKKHGEGNWNAVQRNTGLARCGKSCRLRWANHLRPNLKKGAFTADEERLILELHAKYGNKWARMAAQLPGRTDNEIKNFWNTRMKRRLRQGLPVYPQDIQPSQAAAYSLQIALSPRFLGQIPLPQSLSPSPHLQSSRLPSPHIPSPHISSPHIPSPHFSSPHLLSPHHPTQTPAYASSPLSLLDQASVSSANQRLVIPPKPPILTPPIYRFGRLRNTTATSSHPVGISTAHPLRISTAPSSPSPIMASPLPTPMSQMSTPQLSPMSFESKSPPILQTQFKLDEMVSSNLVFAANSELPSSQFFQTMLLDTTNDQKIGRHIAQSNSGSLDDLLKEAQTMVGIKAIRRTVVDEKRVNDGFGSWFSGGNRPSGPAGQWDDSTSVHSSAGVKTKEEPVDQIHSMPEELSDLLNAFPFTTMRVPDWCSNSDDISNGQSSGLTDDEMGIRMEQLTSSFPIATTADNDSRSWSYMPRIC